MFREADRLKVERLMGYRAVLAACAPGSSNPFDRAEMRCLNGVVLTGGAIVGCGQCMACRINRRRTWAARIKLEAMTHADSSFVTLTYSEEHVPESGLSRDHWRQFTKGIGYRYFGCGEYGDRTWRPHYHLIMFGLSAGDASVVEKRWPYGFSQVVPYAAAHAEYVAHYVCKKLTRPGDARLEGRNPEFAVMSRRPAIGTGGVQWIAEWLKTPEGQKRVRSTGDVPAVVRVDGGLFPLGRTLVNKLRGAVGVPLSDPDRLRRLAEKCLAEAVDENLSTELERKRARARQRLAARSTRAKGYL